MKKVVNSIISFRGAAAAAARCSLLVEASDVKVLYCHLNGVLKMSCSPPPRTLLLFT